MRFKVVPVLGLMLLCSSAWSQTETSDVSNSDVDKAIEWLKELYDNKDQIGNRFDLTPSIKNPKTCVTDDKVEGVCAKTSNCDVDVPKIDTSSNFILREKGSCHFLETCCPPTKVRKAPPVGQGITTVGCGFSNPGASVFREKTGSSKSGYADYGEFPWMVALLKTGAAGWADENYVGGGTLIHPSVVMTAAHKVDTLDPSELKCRAGEWDTQSEKEAFSHQEQAVNKIIIHEEYFRLHVHNDIALLTVKKPFEIEPHINVACLSLTLPAPGTECYSMGWGEDFTKSNKYANLLKKLTLPLVDPEECQRRYRNTRLGSRYSLHRTLTCAGGETNVDTCLGDGGSSLVCPVGNPNDLRYAVVGMVAYGLECGTTNLPGVYVKVPEFFDWVGGEMTKEGFNRSAYVY